MRVPARWLVGIVLLGALVAGAVQVNERLKAMTGRIDLDDQPSRTSIVFVLHPNEELRYRLGQARVLRLIVNANLATGDLDRVQAEDRPLWIDLEIEASDGDDRVLHRQELALHLNPSGGQLDPEARSYLDHRLIPSAGKVRTLDLSTFENVDRLSIRIVETDPSIVDLSVRLFKVTRVAERELAYLWARMSDERRETLARSNLYGQHLMTSSERANQLRHQWFPLPPEGSESRLQRRLYTRVGDGAESLRIPGAETSAAAQDVSPPGSQRSFAYVIQPGEAFSHRVHHLGRHPTPLRVDVRRILSNPTTGDGDNLRWRLLAHDGHEVSSGSIEPAAAPASSERVDPPGIRSSETVRRYFLLSPEVARIELVAADSPVLLTLAVAHPLQPLRVSDDPEAVHKTWFLVRTADHRQRFEEGRAVAIWSAPQPPEVDEALRSWHRLEPDGHGTWRSLSEPLEDDALPGATRQRLAVRFDADSMHFTVAAEPGTERLLVLRWHAPAGRSESMELEIFIDGHPPVNRAMASWTYLRREVSLPPGGGEYPVLGSHAFAQAPQRVVVRIGRELGSETLRVEVRSPEAAGHLSASLAGPAADEWRNLVDLAEGSEGRAGDGT